MRPLLAAGSGPAQPADKGRAGGATAGAGGAGGGDGKAAGGGLRSVLAGLGLRFVSPACSSLADSRSLRSLLGVREFGPPQLLDLLKVGCCQGLQHKRALGLHARCCIFPCR